MSFKEFLLGVVDLLTYLAFPATIIFSIVLLSL
jgi:hypothetical protein